MLDHASKHTDALKSLFLDISDDIRFQYYFPQSHREEYKPLTSTWNGREYVSVHNGQVIGYFKYYIDRDSNIAYSLSIVNFTLQPNIIFAKDLTKFLRDIFEKHKMRKLNFMCYTDNPILDSYKRMCLKYGGRIVGVREKNDRLLDGECHDSMLFEIMRENYLKAVGISA